jgi:hypothetical protein
MMLVYLQEPQTWVPAHASLLSGPSSVIAPALEYLSYFNIYISRVPCLHDLDYPSHLPYKYIQSPSHYFLLLLLSVSLP